MSVIPSDISKALSQAIIDGDAETTAQLTREAIEKKVDPLAVIQQVIVPALEVVGERFENFDCFLPELIASGAAAEAASNLLREEIANQGGTARRMGKVVIGTVQGDIHDIGKNILITMLSAHGFEVVDLGRSVAPSAFVDEAKKAGADIVAMSALMTTTAPAMKSTIDLFKEVNERDAYRIIVGGGSVSQEYAQEVGADGYAPDAARGIELCKRLMGVA